MVLYDTSVVYEWPMFGTVMFSDCRVLTQSLLPSTPVRAKHLGMSRCEAPAAPVHCLNCILHT